MTSPSPSSAPHSPKRQSRLVFCFDGTWDRLDSQHPTNVVLTAESVLPLANDGVAQVVFYSQGVGTGKLDHLSGGIFGTGLLQNMADAYRQLIFNYTPGDEIYVFGFSRGAYTARSFVGLLRHIGIVSRSNAAQVNDAIKIYSNRKQNDLVDGPDVCKERLKLSPDICVSADEDDWRCKNVPEYTSGDAPLLKIKYLGVWDTVGALGVPKRYLFAQKFDRKLAFHDTTLTSMVESARHAVAIDETREDFFPTLWNNIDDLNRQAGKEPTAPNAPYLQQWFPGVHCAVGGGGDLRGLSDETLEWIWDGARQAGLGLDTSPSSKIYTLKPDCTDPLNPFSEQGMGWLARCKTSITDSIWKRAHRKGPSLLRDVSIFARRRWKAAPDSLPEHQNYRPSTLSAVADALGSATDLPPTVPAKFRIIVVKPGDQLDRISLSLFGDIHMADTIFQMNLDKLDDPNHIYAGMTLRVPIPPNELKADTTKA